MNACPQAPAVTVEAGDSRASFQRLAGNVIIETMDRRPAKQLKVHGRNPLAGMDAVHALQEAEICRMKESLRRLGILLVEQLEDRGALAQVDVNSDWQEERTWSFRNDTFTVKGTETRTRDELSGVEGVSDASLAQQAIASCIQARAAAIRDVYASILMNLLGSKHGGGNQPSEEKDGVQHVEPPGRLL